MKKRNNIILVGASSEVSEEFVRKIDGKHNIYKISSNNFGETTKTLNVTDYLDDVSKNYVNPTTLANEAGILTPLLADKSTSQIGDRNIGANRGNSPSRDWYFFTAVSLSWNVGKKPDCETSFEEK